MDIGNISFQKTAQAVLSGRVLEGGGLTRFVAGVADARNASFTELIQAAGMLRQAGPGPGVSLCAIVNAKSGRCAENCAFCAQSAHYATNAPEHPFLDPQKILEAAQAMGAHGARRFGIVTSGLAPSRQDFKLLLQAVQKVSASGLKADASCGILTSEHFLRLKAAGLAGYHHNLETARSFFPSICTTHSYEDDVRAVREALAAGLYVCSGGIFGLGESWEQRAELAVTLRDLGVASVPVNFLHPIAGTPLAGRPRLSREEALKIVALLRFILPKAHIRICGGRLGVFGQDEGLAPLKAGASGLMIGDYLTTRGPDISRDRHALLQAGWVTADD